MHGSGFLKSDNLKCGIFDDKTAYQMVVAAEFLSPTRLRCVTAPHPPDAVTDAVFYGVGASQMQTGGV